MIKGTMPRRKRTDNNAGEPEEKKSKTTKTKAKGGASNEVEYEVFTDRERMEWENDGGKWMVYPKKVTEQITWHLWNEDHSEAMSFTIGGKIKMEVHCERGVQKNVATGWERRVRMSFENGDGTYSTWEYQDDSGIWNPFGLQNSIDLEEQVTLGKDDDDKSVQCFAGDHEYLVDLNNEGKYVQKNKTTGKVRPVRRQLAEAEFAPIDAHKNIEVHEINHDEEEEEEEEEVPEPPKKKGKSAGKSAAKGDKASGGKKGKKEEPEEKVRKVVKKGAAPVDPECPKADSAHVYVEGKDIYDAMLNQTNLQNNNNKYYLMQILEDDQKKSYSVWFRWGRVGKAGQNSLIPHGPDLAGAKKTFCAKFLDKTKNQWSGRKNFVKVPGKYDTVELDYSAGQDEVDAGPSKNDEKTEVPDSKLDQKLQDLINLICDIKSMEEAVVEMQYDAKKAPLGKLTAAQIKAGYAALKKIETLVNKNDLGQRLIEACDEFYTRIPHDFGMSRPAIIRTSKGVKDKMQLLETLADIEVAMNILKRQKSSENPIDTHYHDLKCDLTPMDHKDATFKVIEKYLQNTHASTHNQYKMEILDIFEMDKHGESKRFKDVGNRQLLWHGSRLTNWVGILSQGLRIAPPEAPVTGYMFGKGVYFADMSSKSANYCYATRSKNVGLLLLSEVALGTPNELLAADINADKLPKGTHSVMGKGHTAPDTKGHHFMPCGTAVPLGKQKPTGVNNPNGYTLNYNEFIVYDVNQIKMKYLLKIKFNFKGF